MSIQTIALPNPTTSDATFRTYGAAIRDAIVAAGWVKTTDTGQIDWTTVTRATAAGAYSGTYEMYRMNDTLQATKPVFLKLRHLNSTGSGNVMGLTVQVGSATDGAGALVGTAVGTEVGKWANGAALNLKVSGANNRLALLMGVDSGSTSTMYAHFFERSKDNAGADDGVGICHYSVSPNPSYGQGHWDDFIPFIGAKSQVSGTPWALVGLASGSATGMVDLEVPFFPHFPWRGKFLNPKRGVMSYNKNDLPNQVPVTVNLYGIDHTFLPCYDLAGGYTAGWGGATNITIAARWE